VLRLGPEAPVAWAGNPAVQGALRDDTVYASSASSNVLPDYIAVVAETELLLAVTHDSTVAGA
jgi:hypothetical protein